MASTKKRATDPNFSVDLSALHNQNTQHFVQSAKPQATSVKRQAPKAASSKPQATSGKLQASSRKLQAPE